MQCDKVFILAKKAPAVREPLQFWQARLAKAFAVLFFNESVDEFSGNAVRARQMGKCVNRIPTGIDDFFAVDLDLAAVPAGGKANHQ